MKNYAEAFIQVGDTVLVRQSKKSKLTPYYNPNPMQVTAKKGPMLTAKQPGGTRITRNSVSVFSFSLRWHRSARKGPYALRPVSHQPPQGCPRNSTNI